MKTAYYKPSNDDAVKALPTRRDLWWRSFFDHSEDAQLVCRRDGAIEEANARAIHMLGLEEAAAAPNIHDFLPPAESRGVSQLLHRNSGRQESIGSIGLITDGQTRQVVDLHVTPLDQGFSLVMVQDVSRRWRMESHAQRLMTAVDATPDVIFLTDADFRLTFVNSAFQVATGYTIEDSLGKDCDFLRAPGQEEILSGCRRRLLNGSDWSGELVNCKSDGSEYPVEITTSPIYDPQGRVLGFAFFERDVSLKKRLQDELRRERNFVVSIIDQLNAAIYTVDLQYRLTHVNHFWDRLPLEHGWLKWEERPRPGFNLLEAIPDREQRESLHDQMQEVLRTGTAAELQCFDKTARKYWLVRISPWRHEDDIQGLIYKVTDQTRLHELQGQLYQAQKMETVGALAAGVAHDFNNLLQAIRGHVALLLLEENLGDRIGDALRQIDQAATRASEITQQLLTFSRASEEKSVILDFNRVIEEARQLANRALKQKIRLTVEPSTDPVLARMDDTRAQQLLLNLCVNAIDAMPEGGELKLTNARVQPTPSQVARHRLPLDQEYVRCSVSDTGTGIPPEVMEKMFDPFFTTKESGKGTGLGLAIVHTIIQQSSGFLEIDTRAGQGTSFHIHLPAVEGKVDEPRKKSGKRKLLKGQGRILVVDDMDLVREFARTFLEAAGYTVLQAASGEEALEILLTEEKPFDLVLTDYNMTGMTGQQLIREINEHWPKTKCILASGYLEPQERELIQNHLGASILNKPFNIREAADLIAELLSSKE